ncbi:hypothetical protein ACQKLP_10825 [Chitinophaga sp. NPDC101104]|uniref:hypothetical protein n=1 Tax=Chitinophaga sp. NPDC101104 TaxID=3390561 RepID=UPI003D00466D
MRTLQNAPAIFKTDRRAANSGKHQEKEMATRTGIHAAPHLLRRQWPQRRHHLFGNNIAEIEQRFFNSVGHLCAAHGITQPKFSKKQFPDNITETYKRLSKNWGGDQGLLLCYADQVSGAVATIDNAITEYDLYIIDILPLFLAQDRKKNVAARNALIQTCNYLYHHLGFGHFGPSSGSVFARAYHYIGTMLYDYEDQYFEEPEQQEWKKKVEKEYDLTLRAAKWLSEQMGGAFQPETWKHAVSTWIPSGEWEIKVQACCCSLYALYSAYPTYTLEQMSFPAITENKILDGEEESEYLSICDRFSFVAGDEGSLEMMVTVMEDLDMILGERICEYTPAIVTIYDDATPKQLHDPTYLAILLPLIELFHDLTKDTPCKTS